MEFLTSDQTVCFHIVLKRILDKKNMKQTEVADAIGMPQSTFHDWMTGRSPRDLATVKKIADYFHVEFEYMVFGTKNDQQEMEAKIRRLEFESALLKLEQNKQMSLFETREEAIERVNKLKESIDRDFPGEAVWQQ